MYQNVTVIVFLCWNECRFFFLFMKFPSFLGAALTPRPSSRPPGPAARAGAVRHRAASRGCSSQPPLIGAVGTSGERRNLAWSCFSVLPPPPRGKWGVGVELRCPGGETPAGVGKRFPPWFPKWLQWFVRET